MKTSTIVATALTAALALTATPSLARAYTRTIMGYAAQPVLVPDAGLGHDHASGIQGKDPAQYHQVLYPVALDTIGGSFSAKVAVTASPALGGSVVCWSIAYQANGTYVDVKGAQTTTVEGFQELNLAAVTVPAGGYGSISCWLRAGTSGGSGTHVAPVPVRIHRVMVQQ